MIYLCCVFANENMKMMCIFLILDYNWITLTLIYYRHSRQSYIGRLLRKEVYH